MMRTSYDDVTEAEVPRTILHLVKDLDDKHVEGHNRLRQAVQPYDKRLSDLERLCATHDEQVKDHDEQLQNVAKRTTDFDKVRFSPQMFVVAVAFCAAIVGGQKWSTNGFQEQMAAQAAQSAAMAAEIKVLNAKLDASKQHEEDQLRLQDERAAAVTRDMTQLRGQVTMIDTKLSNLMTTRR